MTAAVLKVLCQVLSSSAQTRALCLQYYCQAGQKPVLGASQHSPAPRLDIWSLAAQKHPVQRLQCHKNMTPSAVCNAICSSIYFNIKRHFISHSLLGEKQHNFHTQSQKCLKQKEPGPSCSSPQRQTIHSAALSAACHFVSSTDC